MGWWSGRQGGKVGDGPADYITDVLKGLNKNITFEHFLNALEKSIMDYSKKLKGNFPMVNFRAVSDDQVVFFPDNKEVDPELVKNISTILDYIVTEVNDLFKEEPTLTDIFENFDFIISDISEYFNNNKTKYIYFISDNN